MLTVSLFFVCFLFVAVVETYFWYEYFVCTGVRVKDSWELKSNLKSIQLTLGQQEPAPAPAPAPVVEEKQEVCGDRAAMLVSRDSSDVVVT